MCLAFGWVLPPAHALATSPIKGVTGDPLSCARRLDVSSGIRQNGNVAVCSCSMLRHNTKGAAPVPPPLKLSR